MLSQAENAKLRSMVDEIDEDGEDLSEWEVEFIANLIDNDVQSFTDKQAEIIRRIHKDRL